MAAGCLPGRRFVRVFVHCKPVDCSWVLPANCRALYAQEIWLQEVQGAFFAAVLIEPVRESKRLATNRHTGENVTRKVDIGWLADKDIAFLPAAEQEKTIVMHAGDFMVKSINRCARTGHGA